MRTYILLFFFFISLLLLSNCSTSPEFKRDNFNDPKSTAFTPDIRSLEVKINNDKTVSLSWIDDSGFEDGFIIGKQLGDSDNMVILDTLSSNTVNYTDNSRQLDFRTTYFVAPFKEETVSEDSLVFKSKRLEFGNFLNITSEINNINEITVSWESDMPYADKFVIKKISAIGNEIAVIDTIDGTKSSYSYTELEEIYSPDIYVDAFLLNAEGEYQEIGNISKKDIYINQPTNLQVSVVDEETVAVTWQDNSVFDEQFIVYQRKPNSQYNPGNTPYIAIDTVSTTGNIVINYLEGIFYEFNIAPFKNGNIGSVISPVIVTLNTSAPEITQIESVSENELKLYWYDNNVDYPQEFRYPTKRFVLEKSVNGGEFVPYKTVDRTISSINIDGLGPDLKYRFRIRSLSSGFTQIHTAFTMAIVEESDFRIDSFDQNENLRSTPLGTYFVYKYNPYGLKFLNPITGNEEMRLDFRSDFSGYSFSPDEKYVAIFQGENPGIYEYETSFESPVYSYSETEREGIFITNTELFTRTNSTLSKIDLAEETKTEVAAIDEIVANFPDFKIFKLLPYKTDSKILFSTNRGIYVYDFIEDKFIKLPEEIYTITDANDQGEILFINNDDHIVLINDIGEVIQELTRPDLIDEYYLEFINAKFVFDNYIVVGTNKGMLLLFNKITGEYTSYHHINVDSKKLYNYTMPLAVSADGQRILTFMRNSDGVGKYLTVNEGWTTIGYEQ